MAIGRCKTASWSHFEPSHEHSCNSTLKNWSQDPSQRSLLKDVSNEIAVLRRPGKSVPWGEGGGSTGKSGPWGETQRGAASASHAFSEVVLMFFKSFKNL